MADRFMQEGKSSYWRFCRWLVLICLMAWLVATLVPLALAQLGITGSVLGWPFVFALAAFVVPLVYLIIIGVFSLVMDRAERDKQAEYVSERTTDE
ncbi:DUF4212 domain-containing protein [Orrella daihaiensis]|uniref:DUF4212 domain-containing protein n=1 Tax=Orrella daihaiensis TaxID=2782176 RepID=A0ABY4AM68_9BURK|nr:sodium/substrate symporter small subunit [Orrella daihaiensis]UOD51372.1 DUF4212 domain-containing protein [Orrella daihaiensis]